MGSKLFVLSLIGQSLVVSKPDSESGEGRGDVPLNTCPPSHGEKGKERKPNKAHKNRRRGAPVVFHTHRR